MQYLLNSSLARQRQKHSSLANPADVQAASCLLTAHLLRFKCLISHHIHFKLVLLFPMHHHYERQLTIKQRSRGVSPSHPLPRLPCWAFVTHLWDLSRFSAPGCHRQSETLGACFPKVLQWSQKCWHKLSAGRKAESSTECWESSPESTMQHTKEWWKSQFRISLQGEKKEKKIPNTIKRPHCVIKWGFADREERDWLGKQPKASNTQLLRECHGLKPNSKEKVFKHVW